MDNYDIIIIGAGPCGLTAALYARRAAYKVLVLEESAVGGQMVNTPEVENYPGIGKVTGVQLSMDLYQQATDLGATIEYDGVVTAQLKGESKTVMTQSGKEYSARAVIIANGARRRKLGIPGEDTFGGKGVSYCATCDGGFFKGKDVAVIGGGNTAIEDAIYLCNVAKTVHVIHRRDTFRASPVLVESMKKRENVTIHYDAVPLEIRPDDSGSRVGTLDIRRIKEEQICSLAVQGVFVAVGLEPDNNRFAHQLTLDKTGYIVAGEDTKTNVPGVFAAGDTRTKTLRQIVTAASDGAVAAFEAGAYLESLV